MNLEQAIQKSKESGNMMKLTVNDKNIFICLYCSQVIEEKVGEGSEEIYCDCHE